MLLPLLLTLAIPQMGFDQSATVHHFHLFPDGGAIEINTKDARELDAIRTHLSHIAKMFGAGDFEAPMMVHDTKGVPGITVLAARHESITYTYADTPGGGRVDVVTTDPAALAALHDFLRYQIREHKTGDAVKVTARR